MNNEKLLEWTIEITKAYFGNGDNRHAGNNPQEVSAFMQEIYEKLSLLSENKS